MSTSPRSSSNRLASSRSSFLHQLILVLVRSFIDRSAGYRLVYVSVLTSSTSTCLTCSRSTINE